MSKINSLVLVIIIAISLSSCTDKSKNLYNTWRVENVKFNKPIPPQMQAYIQSQIDFMKSYQRTTYKKEGTFEDVQGPKIAKGQWDMSKDGKVIYSTDETGKTVRYLITELTNDKFTYSFLPNGPADTLTFYLVPFSAKDTLNKKPLPQQMAPQQQQPQSQDNAPADQQQPEPANDPAAAPQPHK